VEEIAAWLRAQAEGDKAAALRLAAEPGSQRRGVRWTGTPGGLAAREREWRERKAASPLGRLTLDLPEVIARAESVLAVLDAYEGAVRRYEAEQSDFGDWVRGSAPVIRPDFAGPDPKLIPGLAMAVRLLAYGYRSREGWQDGWKP
jgi:hypothetical protein